MSSRRVVDLAVLKNGKPTVVVEAKGREIPGTFQRPVIEQLRHYATSSGSRWAILCDPVNVTIFSSRDFETPVSVIPTGEVLASVGFSDRRPVGERTLTLAVEDWLRSIGSKRSVLDHPELDLLAEDIRQAGEFVVEYAIA